MKNQPNEVVRTSRRVIEHKLLESLEDGNTVAILCSEQDLDDLIAGLCGYHDAEKTNDTLNWAKQIERQTDLARSLTQLRKEAFGK